MVKELVQQNHKIILMPLYRSFADFFVHMYVSYTQKFPVGFSFGNYEDTPRIGLLDKWLRNCGYIFSRRQ